MKCVAKLKQKYNVYVDQDGYIVFFPVESGTTDIKGVDAGIFECMRKTNDRLYTMFVTTRASSAKVKVRSSIPTGSD